MILYLEIFLVAAAFIILVFGAAKTGRSAMSLGRTAQRMQSRVAPRTAKLISQVSVARENGFRIMDKTEALERSSANLSITMDKMRVLISAATEAKSRLDRITGYVGL